MITKSDVILLLTDIQNSGIDCTDELQKVVINSDVSLEVLKFINDNRQLDLTRFYEKIRKSYNDNKSKLYKNIVSGIPEDNMPEILTTLNSYALQCLLFEKNVSNIQMFERFARLEEVYRCLHYYSKTAGSLENYIPYAPSELRLPDSNPHHVHNPFHSDRHYPLQHWA